MNDSRLDDEDYPAITMGQAAQLLGVQPAFLRSLDAAGVVEPARTDGGHRRYSRRQLRRAARLRTLFDEGHALAAAHRIAELEDELSASGDRLRATAADLDRRTSERDAARTDLDRRTDELAETRRELACARERAAALAARRDTTDPSPADPGRR